jgi:hypothetical protein
MVRAASPGIRWTIKNTRRDTPRSDKPMERKRWIRYESNIQASHGTDKEHIRHYSGVNLEKWVV